jgi:hypothetical protein
VNSRPVRRWWSKDAQSHRSRHRPCRLHHMAKPEPRQSRVFASLSEQLYIQFKLGALDVFFTKSRCIAKYFERNGYCCGTLVNRSRRSRYSNFFTVLSNKRSYASLRYQNEDLRHFHQHYYPTLCSSCKRRSLTKGHH